MTRFRHIFADARHGQIIALSGLIGLGMSAFAFEMPWWRPATAVAAALIAQYALAFATGRGFDWRSPTISALSLTLLLRTEGPALVALAAMIAILSKGMRIRGRHVFNPTALGIAAVVSLFDGAWISPGQWGSAGLIVITAVALGLAVTHGAKRLELPLAFLTFWAMLCVGRALALGDPMAIPIHQMSSGALVVFAFFMISDPMTAPANRAARILWAGAVAATGFALQTSWIVDAGPIFGLVAMAPLVPLLDRLFPAPRPRWRLIQAKGDPTCDPS